MSDTVLKCMADHRSAPTNALGYLRAMFTVEDIDDTLGSTLGTMLRGCEKNGERRCQILHDGNRREYDLAHDKLLFRPMHDLLASLAFV